MNWFDQYEPLKADEVKKKRLARKIMKKMDGKSILPKRRMLIGAAAVVLFFIGLSVLPHYFKPSVIGSHSHTSVPSVSQPSSGSNRYDVSVRHFTFTGESKHWKALNKVFVRDYYYDPQGNYVGDTFKDGYFHLVFKGDLAKVKNESFAYKIDGANRGSSSSGGGFPKNGVVVIPHAFADASTDQIKVTVSWGSHTEQLVLKSDPKAFHVKTYSDVPRLSKVKNPENNPLIGLTGTEAFKISSFGWNRNFGDPATPAYLMADGNARSQEMNFLFKEDPGKSIRIVGEHDGTRTLLYQQKSQSLAIQEKNGTIQIPAVVRFGRDGLWKITAFSGQNQLGKPIYLYVYEPLLHNTLEKFENLNGDTVSVLGSSYSGNWSKENGDLIFHNGSKMTIHLKHFGFNNSKVKNPFPILVYGVPYSGGTPFVMEVSKQQVQVKGDHYVFQLTFPFDQPGKWALDLQEGQWAASTIQFTVK